MAVLEQLTSEQLAKREQELLLSLNAPADPNDISQLAPSGLDIRERELIDSLRRDGIETNEPDLRLTPEEALAKDENTQKILSLPSMAGADPNDVVMNYEVYQDNKIGFREALVRSNKLQLLPFVGSLFKAEEILKVLNAAKRLGEPDGTMVDDLARPHYLGFETVGNPIQYSKIPVDDLRDSDMKLVENWLIRLNEEQERGFSVGGRIAQGIAELPAFMIEFLLTGPIFKVGSTTAKQAATKILGRFAEKGVGKLAIRVAGAGFGSLARTAVNIPRILSGTVENMTKGIQITDDGAVSFSDAEANPFGSLARSFTDLYIENLTEIAGPSLKKGTLAVGAGIGKRFPVLQQFTSKLAEKWITLAPEGVTRTFGDFLKASATKVGYDGILEEMGEEQLGRILRSATGLQTFGEMVPSMEDLLVEAGIFSVPGGVSLASSKVFRKDVPTPPIEKRLGLVGDELITGQPTVQPKEGVTFFHAERTVGDIKEGATLGTFLTKDKTVAQRFADTKGEVSEVTAKISNPLIIKPVNKEFPEAFDSEEFLRAIQEAGVDFEGDIDGDTFSEILDDGGKPLINAIKKAGFDALIFPDVQGNKNFDTMLVFDKKQIQPVQPKEGVTKEVVETTVKTKTEGIVANVKEAAVEEVATVDSIRRNVFRAEDALGFWGTAGKKVQRALREISARTAKNVGNTTQNARNILKGLSTKEKTLVAQMTDGAIPTEGQPKRLVARAKMLKQQLDIMQNEAIATGLRKGKLTGRAFPQIPNKKGKAFLEEAETKGAKSHKVFAWAQNQVKAGRFKTVDSAIAALQNYRRTRLRGTEAYFEGTRKVELDLDMREWSPDKLLPGIIEGGWEAIEAARQWGVTKDGNFKSIRTDIERIRGEVGVDQANLLEDYIKAQYGRSRASLVAKKWTKRARALQFAGKLALSPLTITRNMLDRYAKGMSHGTIGTNIRATIQFPPFLNKFMKTSQKIQDEMIRRGAVLGHGHLSEGFASGGQISQFLGRPFAMSERGNQTYIALVKKLQLEADIKRLHEMGGETGTIGKMYDRMLSIIGKSQSQTEKRVGTDMTNEQLAEALSQPEVSDDIMSEVLHRVVTDSAFPLTLASKRMWWGSRPFVEMMTQFKVWSTDQMRFIYKDVLKYTAATGDPSRLARFVVATWMAGELYNIARDFLLNRDESLVSTLRDPDGRNVKEISKSVGNALVDGGIVGMLADLTYGLTDWAFGPTVGSIESITRTMMAVKNDPATTTDGLKKFLLEDVPVAKQVQGFIDRLDRTFFDDEKNNLTANYVEWRQRGFEFRRKEGELSTIERTTGRVVLGRPSKLPGPRTLSHEMIARQVLVGDYEDAAEYMKGIIRDAPVDKVADVVQGIDTSARNRSPFGNIAKKKLPLFLSKFSVEGQAEGIKLQIKWLEGYKKARKMAIESLIAEGFEKELEIKAEEFKKKTEPKLEKFESTISELEELLK